MSHMALVSDEQWVNANFCGASLGDKRLEQRLLVIAGAIVAQPHGCLHAAMPDWAAVMAAYRFVQSEGVTLDSVSQPHRDLTRQACAQPGEYLLQLVRDGSPVASYLLHARSGGPTQPITLDLTKSGNR